MDRANGLTMGDDRANAYHEGDVLVLRASSFGSCPTALIAAGQGIEGEPPPAWLQVKFDEGNKNEPVILDWLTGKKPEWRDGSGAPLGVSLRDPLLDTSYRDLGTGMTRAADDRQFTMEWEILPDVVIRGHLDGIGQVYVTGVEGVELGPIVVEAKAFGDALWDKWIRHGVSSMEGYAMQLSLYMIASGLPALFVVGHKDKAGDVFEVRMEHVAAPLVGLGKIKKRAKVIFDGVESGVLPAGCDKYDYPCPYYKLHPPGETVWDFSDPSPDDAAMVKRLDLLALNMELMKEADAEQKKEKDQIKAEMLDIVKALTKADGQSVTTSKYEVRHIHKEVAEAVTTRKAYVSDYQTVKGRKND